MENFFKNFLKILCANSNKYAYISTFVEFCRKVFLDKLWKILYNENELKNNSNLFKGIKIMVYVLSKILLFVFIFTIIRFLVTKILARILIKEISNNYENRR